MKIPAYQQWKTRLVKAACTYKYVLLVLLAGVILLLIPPIGGRGEEREEEPPASCREAGDSAVELEERLERALSKVQGVGEVEVVLTLKSGPQDILAQDSETSLERDTTRSSLSHLILSQGSGREDAVVIQQLSPQYRGALVVCSGGDDPAVRLRLVEAVSALTGLGADRISVCKGK